MERLKNRGSLFMKKGLGIVAKRKGNAGYSGNKYETDKRHRFNDRLARTLCDNNHEVISVANRFRIFPGLRPVID